MSEQRYVRARDLRPGDIIHPDEHIIQVAIDAQTVLLVTRHGDRVGTRRHQRDDWVALLPEEDSKDE